MKVVRAPWNRVFFDELEAFAPNSEEESEVHDDQVDALSGAFTVLNKSGPVTKEKARRDPTRRSCRKATSPSRASATSTRSRRGMTDQATDTIDVQTTLYCGSLPVDSTDEDWLIRAADMGSDRVGRYSTYERWYDGEQTINLTARQKLFLDGEGVSFTENFCSIVNDSLANRLEIDSIEVVGNDGATAWIKDVLRPRTNLALIEGIVFGETPKLGDGFVLAGWNGKTELPLFSWNRPHIVKPVYSDETGELFYLVKRWATYTGSERSNPQGDAIWRMNIYFPDRVEKWFSADREGEQWERWLDRKVNSEGDDDPAGGSEWPMPWTDDEEDWLDSQGGFHFRNNPQGKHLGARRHAQGDPVPAHARQAGDRPVRGHGHTGLEAALGHGHR